MSPKLLTILPATSQQGLSIISAITHHPTLHSLYTLRALVRNPSSSTAQSLTAQGIKVLPADLNDPRTLIPALTNTHTLILITQTDYSAPDLKHQELTQVQNIISACLATTNTIKHIIFSSAVPAHPHGRKVDVFDSKVAAEEALRTLTLIDTVRDLGKFVVPILMGDTERVYAANGVWSFEEVVEVIGRVTGKRVRYLRMEEEVYAGFMPGQMGRQVVDMLSFYGEVGYYGGDEEGKVRETLGLVEGSRGFEEFAKEKLLKLE
ncbi:NAD(P)-binding protein [Aspergillus niger ATCC 13496]|uniref:NAD(P)-binding protein n=1 Tax=Aspergillus niger ATCC 13496 TaxID=1353008 RepID=A0A370BRB4_ASPNG|nr:NAD(P)-binding protein [Aspergillus niger ATCC 13496]